MYSWEFSKYFEEVKKLIFYKKFRNMIEKKMRKKRLTWMIMALCVSSRNLCLFFLSSLAISRSLPLSLSLELLPPRSTFLLDEGSPEKNILKSSCYKNHYSFGTDERIIRSFLHEKIARRDGLKWSLPILSPCSACARKCVFRVQISRGEETNKEKET